jgi:CheW-like domain
VILETGGGQVGVMVDEVEEVLTVESGQLEPVPTANTDTIDAIAKIDDRPVILLNPEGLFAATPAPGSSLSRPRKRPMPGSATTSGARRVVVADDSRLMRRMLADAMAGSSR